MVEILRKEHKNIARLLAALEHQVDLFAKDQPPDYDVIKGVAEYFLDYPDRCHHPKEDAMLARLRENHPADAAAIGDLEGEHKAMHTRVVQFHATIVALLGDTDIARSVVVDAARGFIAAERRHMQMEEERFFPLADLRLTPADWLKIYREMTGGPDPLFGGKVEDSFRKLSEQLLAWEEDQ
jgi:hemerythrin-like domain-containing protein